MGFRRRRHSPQHDGHQRTCNTYLNAGTYSPRLTVTGPSGTSTTNRLNYIVVTNTIPVANFAANQTHGMAPFRVLFANTSSGVITNASWNFGEGGILSTNASAVSHTYSNAGNYSVSLTVLGPGGMGLTNRPNYILVTNGPPIADFAASATNGPAPLLVTFTNTSLGLITNALWEFRRRPHQPHPGSNPGREHVRPRRDLHRHA